MPCTLGLDLVLLGTVQLGVSGGLGVEVQWGMWLEGKTVEPKHATLPGLCVLIYKAEKTKSVRSWDHMRSDRHSLMAGTAV